MSIAEEHCWICNNHLKDCQCNSQSIDHPTESDDAGNYQHGASGLSNHEEHLESIVDKIMSAPSTLHRIGVLRKYLPDPSESIEQEAEAYANGFYPIRDYDCYESDYDYRTQCAKNKQIKEHYIAGASAHSVPESVKGGMRWVRATDRLPEPFRQKYLKNGANWDLGHYDDAADDFLCLSGWSKRKDLIQWLDESAESTPPQPTVDVEKVLDFLLTESSEERIDMVDGDFYWRDDKDGDQPLGPKDIIELYQRKQKGGGP